MQSEKRMENLARYVEFTSWIKELSSPLAREIDNADAYRATLLRTFSRDRKSVV